MQCCVASESSSPFISPLGLTITPALSSKYMKTPSFRRQGFLWRTTTAGSTASRKCYHLRMLTQTMLQTALATTSPSLINHQNHCRTSAGQLRGWGSLTLLPEVRLSLLDGGHDHVAAGC